jgi:hypothetical protein
MFVDGPGMTKPERIQEGFSLDGMPFLLVPSMRLCTLISAVPNRMVSRLPLTWGQIKESNNDYLNCCSL